MRIFISAVSDEFLAYREQLRRDLTRHDVEIQIQEDFKNYGGLTLEKLDVYITTCDAVVHLVGDITGADAKPLSVQALRNKYPALGDTLPPLRQALDRGEALSYTQWEAWLALYHAKPLLIAQADESAPRGPNYAPDGASRAAQQAHLARLREVERYPSLFTNPDNLSQQIFSSFILDLLVKGRGSSYRPRLAPTTQAIGIDLKNVSTANLRLSDIVATSTGVKGENVAVSGDIEIRGVRAGGSPNEPKDS